MNFPLFVARRIRNTHETSFSKTVTYVGIGTVAMGVSIILIAFAILFGFKEAIQDKLTSFAGDIHVSQITGNHSLSDSPMRRNVAWEKTIRQNPSIDLIQAHLQKPGILVGDAGLAGIVIKGIGNDVPKNQLSKNMLQGQAQIQHPQDIILSNTLAKQLKVRLHSSLILYFLSNPERPRKVKITGIYETGLEELDKMFILADRSWVQKMNGWSADSIGTYEVFLKKSADLYQTAEEIESKMPTEWRLETITELYPALFDWMMMLDRNIVIFISLLLVVACFNLIATLWVLIMERIPMVGLLKAMGASHRQIRTIFWWNGFFILLRGLAIGNLLAVIFCYLQSSYHLIPLDPESYYMSSVPIVWSMSTWVWVNIGTSLLVALIITLPTIFIKKIQAQEALQYKH
ncbi:ABC transporter permease [Aquirufa aurantiipilula]|uniref:FtsX-like permease family protein n=1 Tax=Aquirufa aurantiipilula TaxID=2696561 RepID=A0ABT6BJD4_9BACT|nr:FtsX-like permease family protein [Aquirufa aurantiipilula]MDF5690029.1 FtsX-like permease family protein [Aquirufa aurantiipilula]